MTHSVTRKIAFNTSVQVVGKFANIALAAVSVFFLTRYLGPEAYGKFTIALVYLSFYGSAADLGLFTIAVKRISEDDSQAERIVGNTLALRTLLSLVVIALALLVSLLLPYTPDVRVAIAIASLSLFFGLVNSSLLTVVQARLQMGKAVIADVIGKAASVAAVIFVVMQNLGFYAVVGTAALGTFVTFLGILWVVRRMISVRFLTDRALWKELFWQSLPLGLALTITYIYFKVDTLLLSLLRSNAEVGIYGAAYKLIEILLAFPGFFINAVFPVLNRYVVNKDRRLRPLVQQSFEVLFMLSVPMAAGAVAIGGPLMQLVAGSEFAGSGLALQLLAPALVFNFAVFLFGNMIVALNKQKSVLWLNFGIFIFNIGINLLTIPIYGFRAAAINTVISEALIFIVSLFIIRHYFGFLPSFRRLPRIFLAAGVMAVVAWLLAPLSVVLAVAVATIIYGAGIYFFNGPGKTMLKLLAADRAREG